MAKGTQQFCEILVDAAWIKLVPSSLFGYDDHHVRIGYGMEDLPVKLERPAQYLQTR